MKKINFKLFFYIILVIVILETVIIALSLSDRNDMYLRENEENLRYKASLLGTRLEKSMNSVEILGDIFLTSVKNRTITDNLEEEKKILDDELYNVLITTNLIGGYYEFNINGSEYINSMYFDKMQNKYNDNLSSENIDEIKNSVEEERIREFGWKIPVYVKSWDTNVAFYHKNIYVNDKIKGTVILAMDYNKLEEELLTLNGNSGTEYYLVDSENNILFTNNLEIKSKKIKKIDDNDFLLMMKGIQADDSISGLFVDPKEKRELYSYYKLDNKNIFIMKKYVSRIGNIEFYQKYIWIIILLNVASVGILYILLKNKLEKPISKIDKSLLDISKKKLTRIRNGNGKENDGYLIENYNRVVKSYSELILDVKKKTNFTVGLVENSINMSSSLLKNNLTKETKVANISSQLQSNQNSFDKVYNLMMKNHKLNTATQMELLDVGRNINILKEKFSSERENGDEIEKLTNEINKISFQINVFGLNSTIEMYGNSNNITDFEESSKEIRHLANRVKFLSEEIKSILKKEKLDFQIKNKSLNLIADYGLAFSERLTSIRKSHEKEIIKYVENKENLGNFSSDIEELRKEILTNQDILTKEIYELKKLEESLEIIDSMMNEYKINSNRTGEEYEIKK